MIMKLRLENCSLYFVSFHETQLEQFLGQFPSFRRFDGASAKMIIPCGSNVTLAPSAYIVSFSPGIFLAEHPGAIWIRCPGDTNLWSSSLTSRPTPHEIAKQVKFLFPIVPLSQCQTKLANMCHSCTQSLKCS